MSHRFRLLLVPLLALLLPAFAHLTAATLDGVREVNLNLAGLVYDPFTQKLYASATNDLLQLDPDSGVVLARFPLGTNVTALSLGADNGLWTAISGEHALRRFNLQTLAAEDKIEYFPIAPTFDIAASKINPQTVVFTTYDTPQGFGATFVISDGVVLPVSYQRGDWVQLEGNTLFLAKVGILLRMSIGPLGVNQGGFRLNQYARQFQVLGTNVYSSSQQVFDADTLDLIDTFPLGSPALNAVAKNETESAIYFFYDKGSGAGQLRRYQHPTHKLTGYVELPGIIPDTSPFPFAGFNYDTSTRMISWGTNHLAFFAMGKLFLVDTSKVFAPSDLEVTQTARSSTASFGTSVDFDVTIHNKGPGAAIGIVATNRTSSGLVTIPNANLGLAPAAPAAVKFDVLPVGGSATFSVSVLPTDIGTVTNSVEVAADNEATFANNQSVATSSITEPKSLVTTLNFTPKALAYNPANKRLYFLEDVLRRKTFTPFDSFGGTLIWSLDPETQHLTGGAATAFGFTGAETLDTSGKGSVYAATSSAFTQINPDTLQASQSVANGFVLYDMAVSPSDPDLVFISDENGGRLYKGGTPLPNHLDYHARAEFSNDGTVLYAVNQETCTLNTYKVANDGLTLLQTVGNISCSDFKAANGFLYLNSGAIVDASTGVKLTNSLSLPPSSFVLPRTNALLDVVTRENGVWSVRRLNSQTRQEVRRVTLDQIDGSPTQMVAAGENRVAIRTSGSGLYLVDLDPNLLGGQITLGSNHSATITFDTVPGERYRVEQLDNIGQGSWTPLGAIFVADGITHVETITLDQTKTAFFRLVQNP